MASALPCLDGRAVAADDRWPEHPLRLILPFDAGGGSDIVGRAIAQQLGEHLGQPVVPMNRPGGNSVIGIDVAAKAPPDGYTLTLVTASSTVNVSLLAHKLPFDLRRDLALVTQMTTQPYVLVVRPSLPVRSVADLVALARSTPGGLTFGSSGIGGITHLAGELLASLADLKLVHVPFKGGAPAMMGVIGGEIDFGFFSWLQSHPQIEAGALRPLGVTTRTRSPAAPSLPTIAEAGVAGYEVAGWYGLATRAGTPEPILARLNEDVVRILKLPAVTEKLLADGSYAVGSSREQFAAFVDDEIEKWRRVIRKQGITSEA